MNRPSGGSSPSYDASTLLESLLTDLDNRVSQAPKTDAPLWAPQPGVQTAAYESRADVIGYGGAAGGGKTDLLLGFAGTKHRRSVIYRRVFPSVRGIIERSREIFARDAESHDKDSYNEQLHVWRLADGRLIEFGAVQYEKDAKKQQGQPRDLLGFDEATEFPEAIIRFLMGWNRTTVPGQECRVILTFNPPMDDAGSWIIAFFAPWLDAEHHDPAKDGELRYVVRVENRDVFYHSPEAIPDEARAALVQQAEAQGLGSWKELLKTRTFFHASLKDNPILAATGYGATIEALPEPLRSLLKGNFNAARQADPWQVIPSAWIRAAQARWRARGAPDTSLQGVGVDPARGGQDDMAIALLYGNWCAPVATYPGSSVPDGPTSAALVLPHAQPGVSIGVDVIGIGASTYDSLIAAGADVIPVNNSEGAGDARDRSGKFKFRNVRAAAYWSLREALDPQHGTDLALPDDPELLADLCAPHFKVTTAGIQIEDKDDIRARIGRSPNKGDALVIAHWVVGQRTWLVWGL